MMGSTLNHTLRWLAFVPVAALGSAAAYVVFVWLIRVANGRFDVDGAGVFTTLAGGAVMGVAFVALGTWVAPPRRRSVPWVLAALTSLFLGAVGLAAYSAGRWVDLLSTVLMVVAAMVTAKVLADGIHQQVEDRPSGRVRQLDDGSWVRVRSVRTGSVRGTSLDPIHKVNGVWVAVEAAPAPAKPNPVPSSVGEETAYSNTSPKCSHGDCKAVGTKDYKGRPLCETHWLSERRARIAQAQLVGAQQEQKRLGG